MLTVPNVEMPTLTVSTGIAHGSAKAVESISLATSGVGHRGIDISFIDFFLCRMRLYTTACVCWMLSSAAATGRSQFGFDGLRDSEISIWIIICYKVRMDGGVIQISRRFYFQLFLFVDKHPPSIFTLRDFVGAIAGLFLRRGFRPPTTVPYLSTNIHRPSLLSATSSPLSPVHSYGGYAWVCFTLLSGAGNSVT